jgi:hypothetical protein
MVNSSTFYLPNDVKQPPRAAIADKDNASIFFISKNVGVTGPVRFLCPVSKDLKMRCGRPSGAKM